MPRRKKETTGTKKPDYNQVVRQERANREKEFSKRINERTIRRVLKNQVLTTFEVVERLGYLVEENGIISPAFRYLQEVLDDMRDRNVVDLAVRHNREDGHIYSEYRYYRVDQTYDLVKQGKIGGTRPTPRMDVIAVDEHMTSGTR